MGTPYWANVWKQALANMPRRFYKRKKIYSWSHISEIITYENNVVSKDGHGSSLALARCLGMKLKDPKGGYSASQHIHTAMERGYCPKDPKVREKLLICAGPWGRILAYQKLKELGLEHRYEKPK